MYRSRCLVWYSSTTQTWQDSYSIHVPGLHCNMVSRAMFHALNPLSSSLLVDSCTSFANSLLEKVCILHFPFRQPNAGSRQLKIPLFSENGLCISPPLFKPLMPSCGHPPPPHLNFHLEGAWCRSDAFLRMAVSLSPRLVMGLERRWMAALSCCLH